MPTCFSRRPWRLPLLTCLGVLLIAACGGGSGPTSTASAPPATCTRDVAGDSITIASGNTEITVDATGCGTTTNPLLRGSNVQWVDGGDNLLRANSGEFDATMDTLTQTVAPTILRYPGGEQSDLFHWAQPNNLTSAGTTQPTWMDTDRFRAFCLDRGAEPMITVNLVTGTAAEAARWVAYTNSQVRLDAKGRTLPAVRYWELGNEPYLDHTRQPELNLTPVQFASRVNDFIRAMRAVDPSIRIGLPLSNDTVNGQRITLYPDFARTVLSLVTERFDHVSMHNAYMPFALTSDRNALASLSQRDAYLAAMAAPQTVVADLATMRALLQAQRPGWSLPLAITEYHGLLTLLTDAADWQVHWPRTPAAALYAAELFATLARQPDLLMLNQWSLSGNGNWGAVQHGTDTAAAFIRPVGWVMSMLAQVWQGERLPASVRTPGLSTPAVGLSAAQDTLPIIQPLVTRSQGSANTRVLQLMLINKDPDQGRPVTVRLLNGRVQNAGARVMRATTSLYDSQDLAGIVTMGSANIDANSASSVTLTLPAHSITVANLELSN